MEIMSNFAKSYQIGRISSFKKNSRQIRYDIAIFSIILLHSKIIVTWNFLSNLSSLGCIKCIINQKRYSTLREKYTIAVFFSEDLQRQQLTIRVSVLKVYCVHWFFKNLVDFVVFLAKQ